MLMRQQWPIAALAGRHCARTVHVPCGASSIARIAWEQGWRREALRQGRLDSFPLHSLREHRGTFLHRLLREVAVDPIRPWREFSPDSFLSAWALCIPANMRRDWRIWPFLFCSSPGPTPPTAITPRLWAPSAELA